MKRISLFLLIMILALSSLNFSFLEEKTTKKPEKKPNKKLEDKLNGEADEAKKENGDDKEKLEPPYITIYKRAEINEKRIAITIDDWWHPEKLKMFLDLADEYDCKLTLYPVGVNLRKRDKDMWQRAIDEGHEIGNHTNTHVNLEKRSKESVYKQLTYMEKNLNKVLGYEYEIKTCRYPFGAGRNQSRKSLFAKTVREAGYMHVVLWDVDTTDPNKLLKSVKNGSIILLHGNGKDYNCLKKALPVLKERGYEMVTVSELLGLEKTKPVPSYNKK